MYYITLYMELLKKKSHYNVIFYNNEHKILLNLNIDREGLKKERLLGNAFNINEKRKINKTNSLYSSIKLDVNRKNSLILKQIKRFIYENGIEYVLCDKWLRFGPIYNLVLKLLS